jgi:hypothetical protein
MKRLLLTLMLGILLTPTLAFAKKPKPDQIRATEMVTSGFVASSLIGVAGYLVLRRRKSSNRQS